ncbi:MAG: nucleotide exchange factor GrpE [Hymenobacteraceae bacterium]|nr:nucleotide exchange factor GrpE [Hymenobacteraceae bacterium]MDX5513850.1 nucleotide exchange factor GrpE [Hymenobacteraceae bacterium]
MSTEKNNNIPEEEENNKATEETTANEQQEQLDPEHEIGGTEEMDALAKKEEELSEMKDKYLRLYSEFDNFRRRTQKERADLLKTANQDLMQALLPVLDDLERAKKSMENANDVQALKEGVELVFNKLSTTLQQKGLTPMQAVGEPFNSEIHEAITQVPAPDEDMKGKIVDEIEKGYYLQDKVIRFAKVIIGA